MRRSQDRIQESMNKNMNNGSNSREMARRKRFAALKSLTLGHGLPTNQSNPTDESKSFTDMLSDRKSSYNAGKRQSRNDGFNHNADETYRQLVGMYKLTKEDMNKVRDSIKRTDKMKIVRQESIMGLNDSTID